MPEDYRIIEMRVGTPSAGFTGVRLQARLSRCPSRRWSREVSARFAGELVGHPAVRHVRLSEILQGDEIVLDRIETTYVPAVAAALKRAVDATNQALIHPRRVTASVTQEHADVPTDQTAPQTRPMSLREQLAGNRADTMIPNGWFG